VELAVKVPLNRRDGAEGIAKVVTGEWAERLGIDVVVRLDAGLELGHLVVHP
jgi:hypothetical protein